MSAFRVSRPLTLILAVLTVLALGGLTVSPAVAQTVPGQPPTIVATGTGRASAPATNASVQIIVGREMYGYLEMVAPPQEVVPAEGAASASPAASEAPSGMPMEPGFGATPSLTEADLAPVVDAVVAAGVPEDQITVLLPAFSSIYTGPGGLDSAQLRFSIANPVVDDLADLARAVQQAADGAGLGVQHIGVLYKGSDCAALEQQARAAAVADGQTRAKALNANLGDLIQAADNFYGYGPYGADIPGACVSQSSLDYGAGPGMDPPFDPTQPAEIVIYAAVTLTFAMTPGAAATPSA